MPLDHWLIYLTVVVAIIVAPGPSAALCLTHGARHGKLRTLATVVGGMTASLILMSLSALGLGAAIAASNTLFQLIKFGGALYLVYLGIALWRSAPLESQAASVDTPAAASAPSAGSSLPMRALFRQGFLVGIGNPKDLLFFGALFPQFLDASRPMLPQGVILATTWLAVDGLAMASYAAIGARLAGVLRRLGGGKLFNRLTGSVFIAAGGALATAQKP